MDEFSRDHVQALLQAEKCREQRHADFLRRRDLERTARMAGQNDVADAWLLEQLECEAAL